MGVAGVNPSDVVNTNEFSERTITILLLLQANPSKEFLNEIAWIFNSIQSWDPTAEIWNNPTKVARLARMAIDFWEKEALKIIEERQAA